MTKNPTSEDTLSLPQETQSMQTVHDFYPLADVPVKKLDADEYIASDLDGVTESLVGSGNMNFLMMQAGQTDEAMATSNPFDSIGTNDSFSSGAPQPFSTANPPAAGAGDNATDRPYDMPDLSAGTDTSAGGMGGNITAGSLGASTLAANSQSARPFTDNSQYQNNGVTSGGGANGTNGTGGGNGMNGGNGTNGTPGTNGQPGANGEGGGGKTVINNNTTTVNNHTTVENTFIDNTVTNGDTIVTVVDNNFLTELVSNTTYITYNSTDFLTTITNNVFNTVNIVVDGDDCGNNEDPGPIGLSLDAALDTLTTVDLDFINGGNVLNVLNETIDLSPVLQPVTPIVGDVFAGLSLDILLNPFDPDNAANDYDLHLGSGLDLPGAGLPGIAIDIPLDPAEFLLGDIDIGLEVTNGLPGPGLPDTGGNADTDLALDGLGPAEPLMDTAEILTNPVEDVTGDIDLSAGIGLGLLGTNDGGADSDLVLPVNLDLLNADILDDTVSLNLDLIESLAGDIDLDLGVAADLLGATADPLIDNEGGGMGTDTPLSMLGDALSGLAGHILPVNEGADTDLSLGTGVTLLGHDLLGDGASLVFDPVENLAGDFDIGGDIGLGLLGTGGDSAGDTDITVPLDLDLAGGDVLNDTLDVNLDTLETLTGDLDLNLGIAGDLLGHMADPLFDSADGGTGSGGLLSGIGDAAGDLAHDLLPFGNSGENDLSLNLLTDISGGDGVDNAADLYLDPLESLTSDIDLIESIDLAATGVPSGGTILDGLFDTADGAIGLVAALPETLSLLGLCAPADTGGDIPAWTETLLPDGGGLLGGGLGADAASILPDPVIAAPVITLPVIPALPVGGLLGGGNHHHGGLFG